MKVVVLDRDGTLIEHVHYLSRPSQVRLLPTVREGVQLLRDAGVRLVLHTNQAGVGKGLLSHQDVVDCNNEMLRQLGDYNIFERICIAPEREDEPRNYRKPSPKLGLELMRDWGLDTKAMCYIGDNLPDLLTAKALGCLGIGVMTGQHALGERVREIEGVRDFPLFDSFLDAARCSLRQ